MDVEYERRERVAVVHLDRPERLNAVVPSLVDGLDAAFRRAATDDVAAVVVAGRGRAFCAGWDLKEPAPVETSEQARVRLQRMQDLTRRVRELPAVVVAAVHGYALGAGAELALSCDLVVVGEDAAFGFPEVGVGLSVTGGVSHLLPRLVGPARAKELLLLGDRVPAAEAVRLGLANRLVPAGEHESAALALAEQVAQRPRTAATLAKRLVDHGAGATEEQAMAAEVDAALLTLRTGEPEQGRSAFAHE